MRLVHHHTPTLRTINPSKTYTNNVHQHRVGNINNFTKIRNRCKDHITLFSNTQRNITTTSVKLQQNSEHKIAEKLKSGPSLQDFIQNSVQSSDISMEQQQNEEPAIPYLEETKGEGKKVFLETYGCQMNVSDSEIVMSIMQGAGYERTDEPTAADVILINTCAIRDNAEQKVWTRLRQIRAMKTKKNIRGTPTSRVKPSARNYQVVTKRTAKKNLKVGVLGCMAERLKKKLLEEEGLVDVVAGPDAYRDLPRLLSVSATGDTAMNVQLSADETYADVAPVRLDSNNVSAYVTIMRGCNNMCSYCIVPFTRGRERSRPADSIVDEVRKLRDNGYREITLLGQNVNSYADFSEEGERGLQDDGTPDMSDGFSTIYRLKKGGVRFAELMDRVSEAAPEVRFRFTSPHPKDFPDDLLYLIRERPNLCNHIHIPAQSGSSRVLDLMRRNHTREAYIELIDKIKDVIPNVGISSDFITGFCGETEQDHQDTISLMEYVKYDQAFMFAYSLREKTLAHRKLKDDVPQDVKMRRLREVIDTFRTHARPRYEGEIGNYQLVLVEGTSRKTDADLTGRTDSNKRIVFEDQKVLSSIPAWLNHRRNPHNVDSDGKVAIQRGDFVLAKVHSSKGVTLRAEPVARTSISEFTAAHRQGLFDPFDTQVLPTVQL